MQRFNLSVRVNDNGDAQVEVHDRHKRPLFNPPFADNELGGGILTVQAKNVAHAQAVCHALNVIDQTPGTYFSPAVNRSIRDMVEAKREESHMSKDEWEKLLREPWKTHPPVGTLQNDEEGRPA